MNTNIRGALATWEGCIVLSSAVYLYHHLVIWWWNGFSVIGN